MPRRLTVPDDIFRPTAVPPPEPEPAATKPVVAPVEEAAAEETPKRKSSGRVKHDEKMTVYVTSDELLEIEHARLTLRRAHGLGVDRGRLVRAAVAIVLADLEANGEDSVLVQRLSDRAAG